jgi:predicted nucleic acid-binding protein
LLRGWIEDATFTWLLSEEILSEYKAVLGRLRVRRQTIGVLVNLLREESEFLSPRIRGNFSPDPGDDPFCACAEEGRADFIVTLNPRDFPQHSLSAKVLIPGDPLPFSRKAPRKPTRRRK